MKPAKVYKEWLSKFDDRRYLRPRRWDEIEKVIDKYNVKTALEFGTGVSTALFANKGISVDSYETDARYLASVMFLESHFVSLNLWDNEEELNLDDYDLSLVDGCLPRDHQLKLAIKYSKIIVIDDFVGSLRKRLSPQVEGLERLDSGDTFVAIFKH